MSFFGRLKGLFSGTGSSTPATAAGGLLASILQSTQAPRRGTRELVLAYKRLPWLHSTVRRLAHDVSAIPFEVYRARKPSQKMLLAQRFKGSEGEMRRRLITRSVLEGDLEAIPHPFLDVLNTMNPALGGVASRVVTQIFVELVGETFWVKELNGLGQPCEYWPIPPNWIIDLPRASRPTYRSQYLAWTKEFSEDAVRWLKHPDPENPYGRGVGIGTALGDEMDIDEAATKHLKSWFFNNAVPPAILNFKGLGEDERERFKEKINSEHRGPGQQHQMLVANAEEMQIESLAQTFKDQEINELRRASRDIFVQVLNIPPEIVGIIENSNRATIDGAFFLYATGCLCPRKDFMVSALQPELDLFDEGLVLGYVSPVPEDREFKQKVMVALPTNFTVDEHRKLAGEAPLPDGAGEELYTSANVSLRGMLDAAGVAAEEPAPLPPGAAPPKQLPAGEPDAVPTEAVPAEGEPAPEPPKKPAKKSAKGLAMGDLEAVLEALRPEPLLTEVDPVWRGRMKAWGQRVLNELGVSASFSIRNPLIADYLDKFSTQKIKGLVDGTTRDALKATLNEGVYAGEGIEKLARRVSDTFEFADKVRAKRIARTEVSGAANFANVQAYTQSGVVSKKEWLAALDSKTRQTHRDADGDIVGLNSPFVLSDGDLGMCPGGFTKAENSVNCRCSVLPKIDDPEASKMIERGALVIRSGMNDAERGHVWKRYDRRLGPWEKQAAAALRRGFAQQERDVLDALNALF